MKSVISHSEVDNFLSCERKHWYSFGYPHEGQNGLEPRRFSNGLFRGIVGHEALECYYKELAPHSIDGVPSNLEFDLAANKAMNVVPGYLRDNPDKADMLIELSVILGKYFAYYREEDKQYEFIAVEVEFRQEISETIDFPFKPDLIRRHRITKKVEVVDHKFLANLYNAQDIAISPQLAKYVGALRNLGYDVSDGVYDLICHRVLKTKPYEPTEKLKRIPLKLTRARIDRSQKEQNSVVETIARYKSNPLTWEDSTRRTASSYSCHNCSFLDICVSELNGENVDVAVRTNYVPNTYGYDKEGVRL